MFGYLVIGVSNRIGFGIDLPGHAPRRGRDVVDVFRSGGAICARHCPLTELIAASKRSACPGMVPVVASFKTAKHTMAASARRSDYPCPNSNMGARSLNRSRDDIRRGGRQAGEWSLTP